ncbi:MAG: STAS-like domain-containing protein [Ignavibacteriales bacterium]|nr:STAS-like domain-containing protein [Ignavibacteriales bacterium]
MSKISVVNLLGSSALLSAEKGISLFQEITKSLNSSSVLTLDFTGYEYISSTFINRSFGKLSVEKNWTFEDLKKNISFVNLNSDDLDDIELAVINAHERAVLLEKGVNLQQHYSTVYNY